MNVKNFLIRKSTVGMILPFLKSVNINSEAIEVHTSNLKIVSSKLGDYNKQYHDKAFMATLSNPEKGNLYRNAQTFHETFLTLQRELDYLDVTKHSLYISSSIGELEKALLIMEYIDDLSSAMPDKTVPKFKVIKAKYFHQNGYKDQILQLYYELESFVHDYFNSAAGDPVYSEKDVFDALNHSAMTHVLLAMKWLEKEDDRLKREELPGIKDIKVPVETTPEMPTETPVE